MPSRGSTPPSRPSRSAARPTTPRSSPSSAAPGRRIGLIGFREMTSGLLTEIEEVEFFDLEDDVGAFTVSLPRIRVVPIEQFDPWVLLS